MPRNFVTLLAVACLSSATLIAQDPARNPAQSPAQNLSEAPKQTARQALIEMFLSKNPDDFVKHLPQDTRRTLIHKGDTPEGSWALKLAEMGREIKMQGQHVETFDEGPIILVVEEPGRNEKLEVSVEHDSFMGESDEIELSIKHSQNGEETALPVVPRFIFTMQQEKEIWRLTEVTAAAHIPLTDPDYLKNLRKLQDESNDGMIQMRVNMIVGAERAYAAQHPDRGYSCDLSKVFQQEQAAPAQVQPGQNAEDSGAEQQNATPSTGYMFGFASGQQPQPQLWNGYRFTLSGCEGTPASKYVVTAAPTDPDPGPETKTFCADESGTVKFATGGKSSSCMSDGQPLNTPTPPPVVD